MRLSEQLLDEAEGYGTGPTTLQADDVRQLATLLREAAALAKRYEDAPVRSVLYLNQAGGLVCYVSLPESMAGQRVRIVLDKDG